MTTTDSKGPTASEIAIHVHRAADKLFECDLIDPPTLRYDYLHMGVVKLNEHDAMKQELEALKSWQKHYDRASPDTFAEIKKERDRYREALERVLEFSANYDGQPGFFLTVEEWCDDALNPQEHGGGEGCEHNWEEVESQFSNERVTTVKCIKCKVLGEMNCQTKEVYWPAT